MTFFFRNSESSGFTFEMYYISNDFKKSSHVAAKKSFNNDFLLLREQAKFVCLISKLRDRLTRSFGLFNPLLLHPNKVSNFIQIYWIVCEVKWLLDIKSLPLVASPAASGKVDVTLLLSRF